ncbi:MAG: hypothetical protein JWR55_1749 [Aeromicrobium sp.]|nr:hypothetical protein [Aeromicrobium sp.]
MTRDRTLRVYLRLAGARTALDSPTIRLGTLAHAALGAAGAHVVESIEGRLPEKPRDVAFSWTLQHDLLLRDLAGTSPAITGPLGRDVVLSDVASTVARSAPADVLHEATPVLWAGPAAGLLDPAPTPPAALTLTASDARRLRELGVTATSLLAWPAPRDGLVDPRRVVVAVAARNIDGVDGDGVDVAGVVAAVSASVPGRPVIDVVPDGIVEAGGVRHAPLHPWMRTRLARSADLVLVLGRSASADLVAAEAALGGATCVRVTPTPVAEPTLPSLDALVGALPAGLRLDALDPAGAADGLHLPLAALAGWLVEASGPSPDVWGSESR